MSRIVITGAAGRIGRGMIPELAPRHQLVLLDRRRVPGRASLRVDLGRESRWSWLVHRRDRPPRWTSSFAGADAVLHLAGNPSPLAPWSKVFRNNIAATWNVLEAARLHGVPRVIFASSCHAALGWERELPASSGEGDPGRWGEEIVGRVHRPISPYGLSKAWGELAGRMFVETGALPTFIAVRIGSYAPSPPPDPAVRRRWVIPGDLHWILTRCVEADISGFHVVYGVTAAAGAIGTPDWLTSLLGRKPTT